MQSRITIKYVTYGKIEKTALYKIFNYLTKPRKNVVFRLDFDKANELGWDEEDLFIPAIQINKLEYAVVKVDEYNEDKYLTFMCDNIYQLAILKLLFAISQHGDPGHTFGILFDDEHVGWDGDGSDRIEEINFIENWKKKEFYEYPEKLPEKVLNFNKICSELSDSLRGISTDSPLWDGNVRLQLAEKLAKKCSELQYQKFLEIKNNAQKKEP